MITSIDSILRRLRGSHIALLIALDDHGSLRKAADQVSLSQPAATKALHEIEAMIGAELFVRSPRGVVANEFGRCVIRHARNLRSNVGALREELVALTRGGGGTLAIGAVMEAVPLWLTPTLKAMREVQPDVMVEVWEDNSTRLLSMLDERILDLALGRLAVTPHPGIYEFEPLAIEEMCFVVDRAHPLARSPNVQFHDIARGPWIVSPAHLSNRLLLEQIFEDEGEPFPTYAIETSSTFAMLSLLRSGEGTVTLIPMAVAEYFAECGTVSILPVKVSRRRAPFGIITRRGSVLSRPARTFIDLCLRQRGPHDLVADDAEQPSLSV